MTGFLEASKRGVDRTELYNKSKKDTLKKSIAELINVTFIDDFDDSQIDNSDIESLVLSKNRENYGEKQARHDLSLIAYCRKKRKKNIKSVVDIEWWVITNDERLTYWNQKNNSEYQECLTEIQLSNITWIQKKKTDNVSLMQTIVSLSSSVAISSKEIEVLVQKVHTYNEKYKNDTETLDKISLVFASNMLKASDIKKINADDDAFEQILEEKVLKIQMEQYEQMDEYEKVKEHDSELLKKNNILTDKINHLTIQLNIEKSRNKIEKYKRDIYEAEKEKKDCLEKIDIYEKLINFKKEHEISTSRYVVAIFSIITIFPIAIFILLYMKILRPYLMDLLKKVNTTSDFIQNIICTWAIPLVFIPIYYCIIIIICGRPLSPKELFNFFKHKILKNRTKRYMKKNKIPFSYQIDNIEQKLSEINFEIKEIDRNINELENNILNIENEIETLQSM